MYKRQHLNTIETIAIVPAEVDISPAPAPTVTSSEAIEIDEYKLEPVTLETLGTEESALDDRSLADVKEDEQNDDLYNVKNFAL